MTDAPQVPCLILFYYRNYTATPDSPIPVHGTPYQHPVVDTAQIRAHPLLEVASFTCFEVVCLREPSGTAASDLLQLVTVLIDLLPDDSGTLNLHLAAAGMKRVLGEPGWESHLERIESQFLSDLDEESAADLQLRIQAVRSEQAAGGP